ncbi:hypothetical protein [Allosalinactinospora lopnorensis]|uniref:hypothetical protein n=1 Tax=Allosalinactinospora lopnorensis TaxID=1352348 RepID=UPI000623ECE3|nr:hypothetical protein [Allosalinactinospora lopnorensis]
MRRNAAQPPRPRGRIGRPPRDIGASNAELRARHEAGESLTALSETFGLSRDAITTRVDRARRARAEQPSPA